MKKILFTLLLPALLSPHLVSAARNLSAELSGYILLQTEAQGQAWYVNPVDKTRYYLADGNEAYRLMREFGLGITDSNLAKLPEKNNQTGDSKLVNKLKGRILLQVQSHGEAWYINPKDGLRYYMKDGEAAYQIMRQLSLGITNADLTLIPIGAEQTEYTDDFTEVAYVKYANSQYLADHYGDEILPPASMTKLMTALIISEQYPNWQNEVVVTQEILDYPKQFVGNDATSEVNYKVGDKVNVYDLLTALLIASSNQSARALIDSTGLTHDQFIAKMNTKAAELGLSKTHFVDAAGLSTKTITTAKEMAKLAAVAFDQIAIQSVYSKKTYDFMVMDQDGNNRAIFVRDRNYSLQQFNPDAVKTGYLTEAQRTVTLKKGNAIIVIMHARSMNERNEIISKLLAT